MPDDIIPLFRLFPVTISILRFPHGSHPSQHRFSIMGCSHSTPSTPSPNTNSKSDSQRIRKSQISPPVVIGISPSASVTSKYSNDSEDQRYRYDAPTPPRPLLTRTHIAGPLRQDHNQGSMENNGDLRATLPVIAVESPTPTSLKPLKPLTIDFTYNTHLNSTTSSKTGFSIVSTPSSTQGITHELQSEISHLTSQIAQLIHAIRAYSFLANQTKSQTLSELKNIIYSLPRPPQAILVRQILGALLDDTSNLYSEKRAVFNRSFEAVLVDERLRTEEWGAWARRENAWDTNTGEEKRGLEGLWQDFLMLGEDEMRSMARVLGKKCLLMRVFDLLSTLRAGSEELLILDTKISIRLKRDFEVILGKLRDFEGGIGAGELGDGVVKGFGVSMGGCASMQWRVLSIVEGKRREELYWKMEAVKRGRGEVSVALLGVVEVLVEGAG